MPKRKAPATELELRAKRTPSSPGSAAELAPEHARYTGPSSLSATEGKKTTAAQRLSNVTELSRRFCSSFLWESYSLPCHGGVLVQRGFHRDIRVGRWRELVRCGEERIERSAGLEKSTLRMPSAVAPVQYQEWDHRRRADEIKVFSRPEASWRRMLCSQPPVKTIVFRSPLFGEFEFVLQTAEWARLGRRVFLLYMGFPSSAPDEEGGQVFTPGLKRSAYQCTEAGGLASYVAEKMSMLGSPLFCWVDWQVTTCTQVADGMSLNPTWDLSIIPHSPTSQPPPRTLAAHSAALSARQLAQPQHLSLISSLKSYTATYATTVVDKITLGLAAKIVTRDDEISTVTACLTPARGHSHPSKG
ncbi:hypothetical protein CERZMDRAFT_84347 [Cercospora zeae-maydis SCOH1-5]|uniref:Uncharacterized protein n=1 Tax=Cercospora zeae-maydis SCOH1-5 TaxID=717836 RepID=A0A6A6FH03_9PEZI|nr:hypothetical protein CERZMDRAFT_84347 [Cercospora zeae-maydis SCOH1-5]